MAIPYSRIAMSLWSLAIILPIHLHVDIYTHLSPRLPPYPYATGRWGMRHYKEWQMQWSYVLYTQTSLNLWLSTCVEYFDLFWGHLAGLWLCDVYFDSGPIQEPKFCYWQSIVNSLVLNTLSTSMNAPIDGVINKFGTNESPTLLESVNNLELNDTLTCHLLPLQVNIGDSQDLVPFEYRGL
jgi:hypothetical protein